MTKKTVYDTQTGKPIKEKRKKGHGCLFTFLILLAIIVIAGIVVFRVPEKIGLAKTAAEKMYSQAADTDKAALVMDKLQDYGVNAKGVEVYVMPVKDTDHNTAFIVLDSSKGFNFNDSGIRNPIDAVVAIAAEAQQQGINRAAVVYYDTAGKALLTVTFPTADCVAYSQGKITEKQLMEKVDVGANDVMGAINSLKTALE